MVLTRKKILLPVRNLSTEESNNDNTQDSLKQIDDYHNNVSQIAYSNVFVYQHSSPTVEYANWHFCPVQQFFRQWYNRCLRERQHAIYVKKQKKRSNSKQKLRDYLPPNQFDWTWWQTSVQVKPLSPPSEVLTPFQTISDRPLLLGNSLILFALEQQHGCCLLLHHMMHWSSNGWKYQEGCSLNKD